MTQVLGDISKDQTCAYDAVIIRKPVGQDVKELIKLTAVPTKTQVNRKSKNSINDGYQATYESDPLPEEFVKRHVELYEEQKVLSREDILLKL